jgi:hypothetical protein
MASHRGGVEGGAWVQALGETIGEQLGRVIAESLQRTLESSIDVGGIAARLGAVAGSGKKRKGKAGAAPAAGTCTEPGCGKVVLAKGLCRSHYYKARYKAQRDGSLKPKKRGGGGKKKATAAREATEEKAAPE